MASESSGTTPDDEGDDATRTALEAWSVLTESNVLADFLPKRPTPKMTSESEAAQRARQSRVRHKNYVQSLEQRIEELERENAKLAREKNEIETSLDRRALQVNYLRAIIEQQSTLCRLLQKMDALYPGIGDEAPAKRPRNDDHDYAYGSAGICLHVSNARVSLEMCAECSAKANFRK
ncbi:CREB/ATF bZIP transcription factor-like [Oscarella lobularis]|uniref:CREB/ATF bZIP transcription factor-like n=1 Tax=Oscarella lobularis TaxID=121494 RepID=UPI003313AD97